MLKILNYCKNKPQKVRTIEILILGLKGSGKTEIGNFLMKIKREDYSSTNGFKIFENSKQAQPHQHYDNRHSGASDPYRWCFCCRNSRQKKCQQNFQYKLMEIGGGKDIRKIWQHYYLKSFGIIYCIDSNDSETINESCQMLKTIINNSYVREKPILIIITKCDILSSDESFDLINFYETFGIEALANQTKTPICVSLYGKDVKTENSDEYFKDTLHGFDWLKSQICENYKWIKNRIKFDMELNLSDAINHRNNKTNNSYIQRAISSANSVRPSSRRHSHKRKSKSLKLPRGEMKISYLVHSAKSSIRGS